MHRQNAGLGSDAINCSASKVPVSRPGTLRFCSLAAFRRQLQRAERADRELQSKLEAHMRRDESKPFVESASIGSRAVAGELH